MGSVKISMERHLICGSVLRSAMQGGSFSWSSFVSIAQVTIHFIKQWFHCFHIIGFLTVFVALFIVFFNFTLPDEVKGFVFFAQVIGLIYRNAPYISLVKWS